MAGWDRWHSAGDERWASATCSHRFVNGVLERLERQEPQGLQELIGTALAHTNFWSRRRAGAEEKVRPSGRHA